MPWTERRKMDMKAEIIQKIIQKQQCITCLCAEYEISRKKPYKWLKRYINEGILGLEEGWGRLDSNQRRPKSRDLQSVVAPHTDVN